MKNLLCIIYPKRKYEFHYFLKTVLHTRNNFSSNDKTINAFHTIMLHHYTLSCFAHYTHSKHSVLVLLHRTQGSLTCFFLSNANCHWFPHTPHARHRAHIYSFATSPFTLLEDAVFIALLPSLSMKLLE